MGRFLRVFVVAGVLFALISGYCLEFFIVVQPLVLIPTSLILGMVVGGVLGAYASLLGPGRVGAWRLFGSALVMSVVAGVMGLLLGQVAVFATPFPRGKWTPMALQPPERPVAFLGQSQVRSEGDPKVYVLTADWHSLHMRASPVPRPR